MLNTNWVDGSKRFKEIKTKQKLTSGIKVGFEWEVPTKSGGYSLPSFVHHKVRPYLDKNGYQNHTECGGLECCSPIFPSLLQARGHARWLIDLFSKPEVLESMSPFSHGVSPTARNFSDCGIHVHVSHPKLIKNNTYALAYGLLNHSSMKDFVWSVSGRQNKKGSYYKQAQSSCWDKAGASPTYWTGAMLKDNCVSDVDTLEFRLWAGDGRYLMSALDFAHAVTRYVIKVQGRLNGVPSEPEWPDALKGPAFAAWLMKQKGYKKLKEQFGQGIKLMEKKK